jgi:hypothetical protein
MFSELVFSFVLWFGVALAKQPACCISCFGYGLSLVRRRGRTFLNLKKTYHSVLVRKKTYIMPCPVAS